MESWTMSFTTIYFVPVDSDEEDEEDESHSSREVKMLEEEEKAILRITFGLFFKASPVAHLFI